MAFYVYLLSCADGSFYAGQTDDLDQRMAEHQAGEGAAWTMRRLPVVLVWSEGFGTRDEAREVERQIKGWSRAKKEALVRGDWDAIAALSRKPRPAAASDPNTSKIGPASHATSRGQPRRS